jgi:mannose-1-phosphate guanylyltransferase
MITYLLDSMPEEVGQVVLAAGYKIDKLRDFVKDKDYPFDLVVQEETEPLGTGGGVKNCQECSLTDSDLLIFNGDVISSLNLKDFVDAFRTSGAFGAISLWSVPDPSRYGLVTLDESNMIQQFLEKPKNLDDLNPPYLINSGTYVFKRELFDMIPAGRKVSIEREIFPQIIEKGLLGFPFSGYWIDAGTASDYINAHQILFDSPLIYTEIEQYELIVRLREQYRRTKFTSPVYIGSNMEIGTGSELGPNSCVGDNVTIGEDVRIRNSVIMSDTTIGSGSKLDSVIIGYNNVVGTNCSLSNYLITADHTHVEDDTENI